MNPVTGPEEEGAAPPLVILVVDDEPSELHLVSRILDNEGYTVLACDNCRDALNTAAGMRPDLVLLDIVMPGADGFEVCEHLKSDRATRGVPVIFMSALSESWDRVTAFRVGGADYITKPFHSEELLAKVRIQLETQRTRRFLEAQVASLERELALRDRTGPAADGERPVDPSDSEQSLRGTTRLQRRLDVIAACIKAASGSADEGALAATVCTALAEKGGYLSACVALADQEEGSPLRPVAFASLTTPTGTVNCGATQADEGPVGLEATAAAIRTTTYCQAMTPVPSAPSSPHEAPGESLASPSSLALPLIDRGCALGRLTVTSAALDVPDEEEIEFVHVVAQALTQGLTRLRLLSMTTQVAPPASGAERLRRGDLERPQDAPAAEAADQDPTCWLVGEAEGLREGLAPSGVDRLAAVEGSPYRRMIDDAMVGVFRIASDGRLVFVNPAMAGILGYDSPDEFFRPATDVGIQEHLGPTMASRLMEQAEAVGLVEGLEVEVRRRGGETGWAEVGLRAVRDEHGRTEYFEGFALDLTHRRQAIEQLRQAAERYRAVVEHSREIIVVAREGRVVYANPALTTLGGYSRSSIEGAPITDFVHPDDKELATSLIQRRMAGNDSPTTTCLRLVTAGGAVRWAEVAGAAVEWDGHPAYLAFVADVTERRQAQDELRQSEETLRALFENNPALTFTVSEAGRIVGVSRPGAGRLGYEPAQLVGCPFVDFVSPPDRPAILRQLAVLHGGTEAMGCPEFRLVRRDGSPCWVRGSFRHIGGSDAPSMTLVACEDVSVRRFAEETLRECEARFNHLADALDAVFWVFEPAADRYVYANQAFERLFHLPRRRLLDDPKSWTRSVHPADMGRAQGMLSRQPAECGTLEYRVVRPDGSCRWVQDRSWPVLDGSGSEPSVAGMAIDVTEHRNLVAALQESEDQLNLVLGTVAEGLLLLDTSDPDVPRVLTANPPFLELLAQRRPGPGEPRPLNQPFAEFLRSMDTDEPTVTAWCERVAAAGENTAPTVFDTTVEVGSSSRTLEASLLPVGNAGVSAPRVLVSLRDVSQARSAEAVQARLQAEISRVAWEWTSTFDSVDSGLVIVDTEGRVRRLNVAARDLSGLSWSGVLGQPLCNLGPGEPWLTAARLGAECSKGGERVADRTVTSEVGRTWLVEASPLAIAGGRTLVAFHDITAQLESQRALARKEAMAAMGALVGGVAHEVRNPLFAISGLLDALQVCPEPGLRLGEFLTCLRSEADRLSETMRALLEYGRPVSDERAPTDIKHVVAGAIALCARDAASRKVEILFHDDPAMPPIQIDLGRMVDALRNLVENAIQHTPPGGQVLVETRAPSNEQPGWAEIRVCDTGPGFPPDIRRVAFEPFFSKRPGGTGLGLAIVQRVIAAHEGQVDATTAEEGGGLVVVRLPV